MALTPCSPRFRHVVATAASVLAAMTLSLLGGGIALADSPAAGSGSTAVGAAGVDDHPVTLLAEVRRELAAARHTRYQHLTAVDEQRGEFDYDCSGLLDYALRRVDPAAYRALPVSDTRPLAEDIVHRILSGRPGPWQRVPTVAQLRPGDVVSWLTPLDSDSDDTGHVMVVLAAPTRNEGRDGEWLVRVADSTTSPHAADSRVGGAPTGLGTGTIGLVTDATGRPAGYYWRGGVSTELQRTVVALGRVG